MPLRHGDNYLSHELVAFQALPTLTAYPAHVNVGFFRPVYWFQNFSRAPTRVSNRKAEVRTQKDFL